MGTGSAIHGESAPVSLRHRQVEGHLVQFYESDAFLIDTLGNVFDLYDTIEWWDDANHFINWALLTGAFGQILLRQRLSVLNTFALAVGFGAVTAILWEFGEYFAFIRDSPELATAYTDTLGDLALGLTGSTVAAFVTAGFRHRL